MNSGDTSSAPDSQVVEAGQPPAQRPAALVNPSNDDSSSHPPPPPPPPQNETLNAAEQSNGDAAAANSDHPMDARQPALDSVLAPPSSTNEQPSPKPSDTHSPVDTNSSSKDMHSPVEQRPRVEGDSSEAPYNLQPVDVNRDNFVALYEKFLRMYHFGSTAAHHCKLSEHFSKFDSPPKNQKRTFDTYDFFEVVKDIGGISKIKSWSEVARRLGFDPRGTNIAARVKDWMVYHHIGAFFDYLLGLPNEFYLQADGTPQKYPQSAPSGEGGSVKRSGSEDTGGGDQDEQPRPRKKYRKSSGGDANMTHAAQLQHSMRQQFQQQPPQQLQHPSPGGQDGNSQTWRFVDSIQSKMSGYRPPSEKGARHSRHYKRTGSDRHPSSRPSSGGGSSASRSRSRSPGGGLETESDEEKSRRRSAGSVGTLPGYGTTPSSARSLSRRNEGYPPYTDPQYRGLHHTPQQQHHHGRRDYGYPEYHPSPSGFAHPYASTPPSSGYPYQPHLHYPSMPPHHSSAPPPPPSGYATPDAPESDRYSNAGGTPRMRPIGTPPPAVGDASSEMTNSEKPHGTDPTHPTSPTPLTAPTTNTNSPNQTPTAPPPSSAQPPTPDQLHHRLSKLSHRNAWLEDRNHYLTSRCTELGELLRALNETVSLMRKDVNENRSQMDKVARIKDMMRGLVEELPPNTPRLQPPPPLPNASSSSTPGPAGR